MGVQRVFAIAIALLVVAPACGAGDGAIGQSGTAPQVPVTNAPEIPATTAATSATTTPSTQAVTTVRSALTSPTSQAVSVTAPILGVWVQAESGPVLTYQRRFEFRPDGSYQFVFTSRPTGSASEQILSAESGRYSVSGERLALSPASGTPSQLGWRIHTDPYVGDARLSLTLPDGTVGIYYRP